jgi:hypothetical protein
MTFCLVTLKHSATADKWLSSTVHSNITVTVLSNDTIDCLAYTECWW